MTVESLTVGIVQAGPVFMELEASLDKALGLIEQAARRGAQLVAFGETWLAGYPAWLDHCPEAALWNHASTKEVFARLRRNSVVVPGRETGRLGEAAAAHGVVLVIGVNERIERGPGNGTLYNSLLTFNADGQLVNHHRKLVPTFTERLVWGQGDGAGLRAVETAAGRVGGLVCWEHWMPLARQALHLSGERIHVAVWPTVHEMHQIASRHYAFEARCFVLAAGLIMRAGELPAELAAPAAGAREAGELILCGGSCIIAPDGRYLAGPVFDEETILCATLDLAEIERERMTLDVSGHYNRPDVFSLKLLDAGSRTGTMTPPLPMKTSYPLLDPHTPTPNFNSSCALGVMIKAPRAGASKTRLVPPLTHAEAAALSVCFLRDTTTNISDVTRGARANGVAVYTPVGAEAEFDGLLPAEFSLLAQRGEAFGERLLYAAEDLLAVGYESLCLIDSDSPTLPAQLLTGAVDALACPGDRMVLRPTGDGGYYLIGLKRAHARLFADVAWSTAEVFRQTVERAAEIDLEVVTLPMWYDVDDAHTLARLCHELFAGETGEAAGASPGYNAPHTRDYLSRLIETEGRGRIWPETPARAEAMTARAEEAE